MKPEKLRAFLAVLKREGRFILKDKDILIVILLSPIFYAFFYGSIYMNKTENNVPIVVVDYDRTTFSRSFIRNLNSHQLIHVQTVLPDFEQARHSLYGETAEAIVYLPAGFETNLKLGKQSQLRVYLNTSRFLIANDINKAISEITLTAGAAVRIHYFESRGYGYQQAREMALPLQGDIRSMFNTTKSYGDFLLPGLLVLIIQQTLLIGLSESISKEREDNLLGELYNTAKGSIWVTMSGKSVFYFLLYGAYTLFFFVIHFSLYRLNFNGSVAALIVLTILLLVSVIYLGIFISSFFHRKIIALQFFVFTSYPVFLLSGYSWPVQAMPKELQVFSQLVPSTPYLQAFVRITQMGAGWSHIWPEFFHLMALAATGFVLSRIRMKWLINRELGQTLDSPIFRLGRKLKS